MKPSGDYNTISSSKFNNNYQLGHNYDLYNLKHEVAATTISSLAIAYGYLCLSVGFLFTVVRQTPILDKAMRVWNPGHLVDKFGSDVLSWLLLSIMALVVLAILYLGSPTDADDKSSGICMIFLGFVLGSIFGEWFGMLGIHLMGATPWKMYAIVAALAFVLGIMILVKSCGMRRERKLRKDGYFVPGTEPLRQSVI